VTSGGVTRTTGFIYTPYGRLVRITEPSGAYIEFGYDAAQRVTSATDNLGNRVDYTLDGAGNIRDERYKTAAGPVARRVSRVFNDINRLQSITGALQ
jgi:YD repeat-containing protein